MKVIGIVYSLVLALFCMFLPPVCCAAMTTVSKSQGSLVQDLRRINKAFAHNLQVNPNQPAIQQILMEEAKQRKSLLLALLPNHPDVFLHNALPQSAAEKIPVFLNGLTEKYAHLQGVLVVLIQDDFLHKRSRTDYFLTTIDKNHARYQLYFLHPPAGISSGSVVWVQGILLGNQMVINNLFAPKVKKEQGT